jgi:hypothetical protein
VTLSVTLSLSLSLALFDRKSQFETVNESSLMNTVNQIKSIVESEGSPQFIIIHGAGSAWFELIDFSREFWTFSSSSI